MEIPEHVTPKCREYLEFIIEHPNMSKTAVADHFNVVHQTIDSTFKHNGIRFQDYSSYRSPYAPMKHTAGDIVAYIRKFPESTIIEIAQHFDVTKDSIRKRLAASPYQTVGIVKRNWLDEDPPGML